MGGGEGGRGSEGWDNLRDAVFFSVCVCACVCSSLFRFSFFFVLKYQI